MMVLPSKKLFNIMIFMTYVISLSISNWIFLWAAMEMNLLTMIPILLEENISSEIEAMIKYMIPQSMASMIMLLSMMGMSMMNNMYMMSMLFMLSVFMKVMIVPFHIWLPSIINNINWWAIYMLTTWQKVLPLIIMKYIMNMNMMMMLFMITLSALMSSLLGINQTNMRSIIAYSSINHTSWMIISDFWKADNMYIYFFIYILLMYNVFFYMNKVSKKKSKTHSMMFMLNINMSMSMMLILLNMAGVPPLVGFAPKLLVLWALSETSMLLTMLMIISSCITLFFYVMVFFNLMYTQNKFMKVMMMEKKILAIIVSMSIMLFIL